jgi:hypothetical protein
MYELGINLAHSDILSPLSPLRSIPSVLSAFFPSLCLYGEWLSTYFKTVWAYFVTSTPPALFHLSTNSSKAEIGFLQVTMSAQYSL